MDKLEFYFSSAMELAVPEEGSGEPWLKCGPASWEQLAAQKFDALWENEAPVDEKAWQRMYYNQSKGMKREIGKIRHVRTMNERPRFLTDFVEEMLASFEDAPKPGTNSSGLQSTRSDVDKIYTDKQLLEILEGVENTETDAIGITDSIPEPLSPMERNLSVALTVLEAATSSERSQSLNQGEPSCTAAMNKEAVVPGSSPPLGSQKPTCAAQKSPEPEPSSVGQNLHQEPCSRRTKKIRKASKSQVKTLARKLRDAREDLAAMAKHQASCMEIVAKAMQKFADNDKERNEMFRTLVLKQKSQTNAASASADTSPMMRNRRKLLKKRRGIFLWMS